MNKFIISIICTNNYLLADILSIPTPYCTRYTERVSDIFCFIVGPMIHLKHNCCCWLVVPVPGNGTWYLLVGPYHQYIGPYLMYKQQFSASGNLHSTSYGMYQICPIAIYCTVSNIIYRLSWAASTPAGNPIIHNHFCHTVQETTKHSNWQYERPSSYSSILL